MKTTITLLLVLFTSIATFGQTTETRYYNGKYTKETALQKTNEYITQLKNKGFNFTKAEGKSVYQFSGTWVFNNGANTTIEYVVGDNNLTVKLTKCTNKGMNITEIVRDEKHHLHGAVKALYDVEVLNYITKLFDYLQIKNNTTSNTSQTTTTAGSNTNTADLYIDLSTEARAFMETYKTNPKGLKNHLENHLKSWEQKGYSTDKVIQSYVTMFKEIYTKDKDASYELLMRVPQRVDIKKVIPMLSDEEKAFVRKKNKERIQNHLNSNGK